MIWLALVYTQSAFAYTSKCRHTGRTGFEAGAGERWKRMDLGLAGRKAIVTGATRGIGRRIAEILADEGCSVGICARGEDGVRETVAALSGRGVKATGAALNVRNAPAYKAWLQSACEELGGLDILVANISAGGGMDSERNWYRNFEIDLMSTVRGVEVTLPFLKQSSAASILVIGTMAAAETFSGPMAYNAIKAALITYAQQLSQELMKVGIRVNCLSPGPTLFDGSAWEMVQIANKKFYSGVIRQQPARRMAVVDEIARPAVFLASPAASWVSGGHLLVDGGYSKRVQF